MVYTTTEMQTETDMPIGGKTEIETIEPSIFMSQTVSCMVDSSKKQSRKKGKNSHEKKEK